MKNNEFFCHAVVSKASFEEDAYAIKFIDINDNLNDTEYDLTFDKYFKSQNFSEESIFCHVKVFRYKSYDNQFFVEFYDSILKDTEARFYL